MIYVFMQQYNVRNIDVTLVTESEDEWHTIVRNIDVTLVTESEDEWHTIVRYNSVSFIFWFSN
jgi:hypothetical protein